MRWPDHVIVIIATCRCHCAKYAPGHQQFTIHLCYWWVCLLTPITLYEDIIEAHITNQTELVEWRHIFLKLGQTLIQVMACRLQVVPSHLIGSFWWINLTTTRFVSKHEIFLSISTVNYINMIPIEIESISKQLIMKWITKLINKIW